MRWTWIVLLWITFSPSLFAGQPMPRDFAFGIPLKIEHPGTLYKVSLPETIYTHIDRKDFGDIRVFNKKNDIVPHSLKRPESKIKSTRPSAALPFFPVFKSHVQNSATALLSLTINTDSKGAILNVKAAEKDQSDTVISHYLIDLTLLEHPPDTLLFKWRKKQDNYSIKTPLEYSNNLTDWQHIHTDATLASYNFSGHAIIKNKIALPLNKMKYLRMTWPHKSDVRELLEVHALFPDKKKSYPHQWRSILPQNSDVKLNMHEYEIKGVFPVSLVNMAFFGKNKIFKGALKSRPDKNATWITRYTGLFYNIDINGINFSNNTIPIRPANDQYWQLTFTSENNDFSENPPKLEFGWIPHDIYFLNQGEGPFTIAFGNFEIEPLENLVDQLLVTLDEKQQIEIIKTAVPGKVFKLGEKKVKRKKIQWQKWILWTVLIMGVFLLGVMAIRLLRQLNISAE